MSLIDAPVAGDRVELVSTSDEYTRLQPGDRGTVTHVRYSEYAGTQIAVKWDSGSTLTMLPDEGDRIRKVDG